MTTIAPKRRRSAAVPIAITLGVLVAGAVGLLHFMPLAFWIPAAERIATERIGERVSIGNMRYALFPSAALTLENVTVGASQDVKISTVIAGMGPGNLITNTKEVSEITLRNVTIDQDALVRALTWAGPAQGQPRLATGKVVLRDMRVAIRGMQPLTFNGEIQLGADGATTRARLRTSDNGLTAEITPKGDGADLAIQGSRFTAPLGPAYEFENFQLTASVSRKELGNVQAEGSLFGGKFKATGQARFGTGIVGEGEFTVQGVNVEPLIALFAASVSASGNADIKGRFAIASPSLEKLFAQSRVEGSFTASKGTLGNIDLVRAVQAPAREGVRGGRTRYNEMAGTFSATSDRIVFRTIRVSSDSMASAGSFEVAPNGELNGRLAIQVGPRGTVVASGAVALTGEVRNPILRP